MSHFSEELQRSLRRSGLTQSDIARDTGISTGLISQYASGRIGISAESLAKLLRAFHAKFWPNLLDAHYADETPLGAEWAVTRTKNAPEGEDRLAEESPDARSDFEKGIDELRRLGVQRPEIRQAVISLSQALRWQP